MDAQGRALPRYVRREFDEYLKCGRLEYGFICLRCDICHAERLLAFSCMLELRSKRIPGLEAKAVNIECLGKLIP